MYRVAAAETWFASTQTRAALREGKASRSSPSEVDNPLAKPSAVMHSLTRSPSHSPPSGGTPSSLPTASYSPGQRTSHENARGSLIVTSTSATPAALGHLAVDTHPTRLPRSSSSAFAHMPPIVGLLRPE